MDETASNGQFPLAGATRLGSRCLGPTGPRLYSRPALGDL